MASLRGYDEGIHNIVTIGVPDIAALSRVEKKLLANAIPHYSWSEPDFAIGFTSITTVPIEGEQRAALQNYRVYNEKNNQVYSPGAEQSACRVMPDRGANSASFNG